VTTKKRMTLGKGLGALLGVDQEPKLLGATSAQQLLELPLEALMPGAYQPRRTIQESDLQELADSIRAQGILQPILVRKQGTGYEIIAGERRWRAAKVAGLKTVPVMVKAVSDESVMLMGLIENMQRTDLSVLEEAEGIERLSQEFQLTHQQIADALGKSRAAVTNLLRLLNLSDPVKQLLKYRKIEIGHAKALLGLSHQAQGSAAEWMVDKGLSVREAEQWVSRFTQSSSPKRASKSKMNAVLDPDVKRLVNSLSEKLGAVVTIETQKGGQGKLIIRYHSLDELEGILGHFQ
jgi:ParB family chromosome partitioning protein